MPDLIVTAFDDPEEAPRVLDKLREAQSEYLIELEDACVVKRKADGTIKLKQAYNLVAGSTIGGAAWGGMLGALAGLLFLNPIAGFVAGAAAGAAGGAVSGSLADIGINDDFIRRLGNTLPPNSSALFILVRQARFDRLMERLKPFNGRIIHTSLTLEDEAKLRDKLGGLAGPMPSAPTLSPSSGAPSNVPNPRDARL